MVEASEECSPECCMLRWDRVWCVVKECGGGVMVCSMSVVICSRYVSGRTVGA